MRIIFILLFKLVLIYYAFGGMTKANIGDFICITNSFIVQSGDSIIISGSIELSEPTLFYPESVSISNGNWSHKLEFSRPNDSIIYFDVTITEAPKSNNYNISLCGEVLAGADTICILDYSSLKLNNKIGNQKSDSILVNNRISPLPYIRIAWVEDIYPNPVNSNSVLNLVYVLDQPANIRIWFINSYGQRFHALTKYSTFTGTLTEPLNIPLDFPTGCWYILIETDIGRDFKKFIVIK